MRTFRTRITFLMLTCGGLMLHGCETTGLASRDAYTQCILAALGGAAAGALVSDDREGALIGAALAGVSCLIYKHMSASQIAQMEAGTEEYLSSGDTSGEFEIEGGTVKVHDLEDMKLEELVTESELADVRIEDTSTCRGYTSDVSLDSGPRLEIERVSCVDENGDFVHVKKIASTVS